MSFGTNASNTVRSYFKGGTWLRGGASLGSGGVPRDVVDTPGEAMSNSTKLIPPCLLVLSVRTRQKI